VAEEVGNSSSVAEEVGNSSSSGIQSSSNNVSSSSVAPTTSRIQVLAPTKQQLKQATRAPKPIPVTNVEFRLIGGLPDNSIKPKSILVDSDDDSASLSPPKTVKFGNVRKAPTAPNQNDEDLFNCDIDLFYKIEYAVKYELDKGVHGDVFERIKSELLIQDKGYKLYCESLERLITKKLYLFTMDEFDVANRKLAAIGRQWGSKANRVSLIHFFALNYTKLHCGGEVKRK
jgi:hypothetical protein